MIDKIEFIEEMAVINCQRCPKCWEDRCDSDCPFRHADRCNSYRAAERYYDLGYRKEKDTAKEIVRFLEKLKVKEDGKHDWRENHNDCIDKCKRRLADEYGIEINE